MKIVFRLLILASIAAAAIASAIPFEHSYPISIALDQPPPLSGVIATFLGMAAIPLLVISAFGLLAFRRWSRPLSKLASLMLVLFVAASLAVLPFLGLMSTASILLFAVSALAWGGALVLSHSKALSFQFLGAR